MQSLLAQTLFLSRIGALNTSCFSMHAAGQSPNLKLLRGMKVYNRMNANLAAKATRLRGPGAALAQILSYQTFKTSE